MSKEDEIKKRRKERSKIEEELEKEALEDMKPVKGSPDSLKEGEPDLRDVTKKASVKDKKKEGEDKSRK